MLIIDSHTHLMTLDTERYPLADPSSGYQPAFEGSANALHEQMQLSGVSKALAISTGFYGWDNSYVLDQHVDNKSWLAVAALVDPAGFGPSQRLDALVEQGVCGLRIQRHLFYQQPLDDPISTPLWCAASDMGLTVDINATHEEYAAVEARVRAFPQTRFVLDHCGYVSSALVPSENTTAPVRALARYENVYIKLTFLPLASRQVYPFTDVHWMVRELVDAFGPDRCLFGSNFPTVQYSPQTRYEQTVALFADAVDLSVEERAWILGGTAQTLWRWS